eukprot:CAMPEP_0196669202 /NCGR_PEP_ID=MMETSP1090-20130531/467_1 /TAXON_ID=37098 /ORGANISM="Isochrysis sp, Strain CCMP1244" /LENGTH=82 /DNA_ID=CAMNT_0042006705 /DNA_START=160 /DNA_END=408 /DNA_ORIENTATION=-
MSKTTHTASSREPGSWMENVPQEERAAAMSEAAPPPKTSRKGGLGKRTDGRRRGGSHNLRALHGGNSASCIGWRFDARARPR